MSGKPLSGYLIFDIDGRIIEKRVVMPYGQNTTVYIDYRLLDGRPIRLNLRPYVSFRGHGEPLSIECPSEWPFNVTIIEDRYEIHHFNNGGPMLRLCMRPYHGVFVAEKRVANNVLYRMEQERGYNHVDSLFSPGYFTIEVTTEKSAALVGSTELWEAIGSTPDSILEAERKCLRNLLNISLKSSQTDTAAQLVIAADQFVIFPGTRPEERFLARTIVAGYHWFTDWGRDTMISLEGLTLCTGRYQQAKEILCTFSHYVRDGLLPNHFQEGEKTALYNTVDATLWYFHAIDRYYQTTGDIETLRPNQIFSMSLRFPILIERLWCPVLDAVIKNLLTPVGLRSLAPGSEGYHPRYYGDRRHRDAAYHQGTVMALADWKPPRCMAPGVSRQKEWAHVSSRA